MPSSRRWSRAVVFVRSPRSSNASSKIDMRRAEPVVARAVARGELPADTDPPEVIKTLIAPIYLRLLITAEPIDEMTAKHAARVAVAAARGGVLRAPSGVSAAGSAG